MIKGTILLFLKQDKAVYLLTKFQVSSITLTSFRQGEGVILPLPPLTPKRTSKKATQIRVKIDPLQLFLKSYKDNCTTLILCNKASASKLNFKNILNTNRAGKLSNRNFAEVFFAEQASLVPSSFRTVVLIALRM